MKTTTATPLSPVQRRYIKACTSLYFIVAFSVINIFATSFTDYYFLFSAFIPNYIVTLGLVYAEAFESNLYLVVSVVLAAITIVPYLLSAIFCKKKPQWMIIALVLFSVDTVAFLVMMFDLILSFNSSIIIDLAFHIWALACLVQGVVYGNQKMEQEEAAVPPQSPPHASESNTVTGGEVADADIDTAASMEPSGNEMTDHETPNHPFPDQPTQQ